MGRKIVRKNRPDGFSTSDKSAKLEKLEGRKSVRPRKRHRERPAENPDVIVSTHIEFIFVLTCQRPDINPETSTYGRRRGFELEIFEKKSRARDLQYPLECLDVKIRTSIFRPDFSGRHARRVAYR
jgi:hypothetical protein